MCDRLHALSTIDKETGKFVFKCPVTGKTAVIVENLKCPGIEQCPSNIQIVRNRKANDENLHRGAGGCLQQTQIDIYGVRGSSKGGRRN